MKKYEFSNVNNIFVSGNSYTDLKRLFKRIKSNIIVKKEDEDGVHPLETERQARKAAIREAALNARMNARDGNNRLFRPIFPHDGFDTRIEMPAPSEYIKKMSPSSNNGTYSNAVIFVTGDCGIGFNNEKYYANLFEKYNKIFQYNNLYLIFIRGNHDNPDFFDGEKVNLSNIKAVPDYSVVSVKGKNILCVGGAISTDRQWRKEQEIRINKFAGDNPRKLYFENEAPVLDKDSMDEIFKEFSNIDFVISHTAPSFVFPTELSDNEDWEQLDKDLKTDIANERLVMDRIFEYLRDNNRHPSYWAYGHFNITQMEKRSDTWFRSLDGNFNPFNAINDLNFAEMMSKEKKRKKKAKKSVKTSIDNLFDNPAPVNNDWQNDEMFEIRDEGEEAEEVGDLEGGLQAGDAGELPAYDAPDIAVVNNDDDTVRVNAAAPFPEARQVDTSALENAIRHYREQMHENVAVVDYEPRITHTIARDNNGRYFIANAINAINTVQTITTDGVNAAVTTTVNE